MRKLAFLISFGINISFAQVGLSTITLKDSDKGFLTAIYTSLLKGVENEEALSFTDNTFLVPNSKETFHKIIRENKLDRIPVSEIKVSFQWDTHSDCARLFGCAPVFKKGGQNIYFWLEGNYATIFSKELYALFLKRSKEEFFKLFNILLQADSTKNLTIRRIDLKKESGIYHVPFEDIVDMIGKGIMRGDIVAYRSHWLDDPIDIHDAHESNSKSKQNPISQIYVLEQWRDSTVKDLFTFPAFCKTLKAIGFKPQTKKEVWIDERSYYTLLSLQHPDLRETKENTYKLYMESSFCKAIRANIYIK